MGIGKTPVLGIHSRPEHTRIERRSGNWNFLNTCSSCLQTKGEYISRLLFSLMQREDVEQDRMLVEAVTLVLFSYGQETREAYLFARLLQVGLSSRSCDNILTHHLSSLCTRRYYGPPALRSLPTHDSQSHLSLCNTYEAA